MNKQEKASEIIKPPLFKGETQGEMSEVPKNTQLFNAQLLLARNKNPG